MSSESPSIFERIVAREIPADIVFENERIIAIRDIAPQAPVHLLVVPKTAKFKNVAEIAEHDAALLAEVVAVANSLAVQHTDGEFRLIFNTGATAGQTVFHVHAHVLGTTEPGATLKEGNLVG